MTQPRVVLHMRRVDWARYDWLLFPALVFLITRLVLVIAGYLALAAISHNKAIPYLAIDHNNLFADMWSRYDSEWYLGIANYGYWNHPGEPTNTVFFPLYPLLVHAGTLLTGSAELSGIFVSNICLFGALIFLYRLTTLELQDFHTARRAVLYIAIFPTALFFGAIYTESAFFLFSVGAMYFARRRLWAWAALLGLLAAVTRVTGILIWGVVLLEWMRCHGWTVADLYDKQAWISLFRGVRDQWLSLLIIFTIPLGLVSQGLFFQSQFGNALIFVQGQAAWGRQASGVLASIIADGKLALSQNYPQGTYYWNTPGDVLSLLLFVALAVFVWRRLGEGYALYMLLALFAAALNSTFSMSRFVVVLFPAFMLLAHWGRNTLVDRFILVVSALLLGVFLAMFVNWAFVA